MAKMVSSGLWELPRTLAQNLPLTGTYYLAYIPLQTALELASTTVYLPVMLRFNHWRSRWLPPRRHLEHSEKRRFESSLGEMYSLITVISVIGKSCTESFGRASNPTLVIIYALFSPLILPMASLCAALSRLRFRYTQVCIGKIPSVTNGELYHAALHSLFWGILVMELSFIGLFLLKVAAPNLKHDVAQISTLLLLFYGTYRHRRHALKSYRTDAGGFGVLGSSYPTDVAYNASTHPEYQELSRPWESDDGPVDDSVIWVAEDPHGVSSALISSVRLRYASLHSNRAIITNAHATVDAKGNVILDMVKDHEGKAGHR
jgi:hypothetical protein